MVPPKEDTVIGSVGCRHDAIVEVLVEAVGRLEETMGGRGGGRLPCWEPPFETDGEADVDSTVACWICSRRDCSRSENWCSLYVSSSYS